MTRAQAAKFAEVCYNTVTNFWQSEELKINGRRVLKEGEHEEILKAIDEGTGCREVAKKFNISTNTVYRHIRNREKETVGSSAK